MKRGAILASVAAVTAILAASAWKHSSAPRPVPVSNEAAQAAAPVIPAVAVSGVTAPATIQPVVRRRHHRVHRRTYVTRRTYYSPHRVYVKRRSKKKSAAIVAGSAAGGAAIGGLAGGGKGAAAGALAGGGAGLVYDRLTHKKRVVR